MIQKTAVIATGGKQYLVAEGDTITVEKLQSAVGEKVIFDAVLLTVNGQEIKLGQPTLPRTTVEGTVLKQGRGQKLFGVKFKAKKRYMRVFGHRQTQTVVKITKIQS